MSTVLSRFSNSPGSASSRDWYASKLSTPTASMRSVIRRIRLVRL